MAQSATRPEDLRDPRGDRIIPVGGFVCLCALLFAPAIGIRSPEAEALEAALDWTVWCFVIGLLGCGVAWLGLRFRKPPRHTALDGALERITRPPEAGPVGAEHHWLAAAYYAVVFPSLLAMQAPETLEALISVGGPRGFVAVAAWLGFLAFGSLMLIQAGRRAILAGRPAAA